MTEEEAKKKWCPFARDAESNALGLGYTATNTTAKCIGSECMAWRRNTRGAVKSRKDASIRLLNPGDTYDPGAEIHFEAYDETSGHCGLAGKP